MNYRDTRRNKFQIDYVFFFVSIFFGSLFFILFISLKNECVFTRNEIYHLENIKNKHVSRIKVYSSKIKLLSRKANIEKIASERFDFYTAQPESLIVYIDDLYVK